LYSGASNTPQGNTWFHTAFTINASPSVLAICGTLDCQASSTDVWLNGALQYDPALLRFNLYDEDRAQAVTTPYPYTLTCDLADYDGVQVVSASGKITIFDPCDSPFDLSAVGTGLSETYDYVGSVSLLDTLFTVDPSVCASEATFECDYAGGPYTGRLNMCDFTSENTAKGLLSSATFNPVDGEWIFQSNDKESFPPGAYTFDVTVTIGDKSVVV
jgi:hypothetical protein